MDLLLRNARLLDGRLTDIGIQDGVVTGLKPGLTRTATSERDLDGKLTLPAFVNGQLHACKVFWRRKLDEPVLADSAERFALAKAVKESYTPKDVFIRVSEVVKLAVLNGTCAIRLFADVDEASGLNALEGLLEVKRVFSKYLTIQVVAFPQDGVFGGNARELMEQALSSGADVVGGIPWVEVDEAARRAHTDMCFDLAARFDKDLHLVCDDTVDPTSRTLEYVAQKTVATGYQGRVAATQCAALAFYDDEYAARVIQLVKAAGITIFANSQVSLVTTELGQEPYARGITRVQALLEAGVPVACAQDDIDNWYYPFGRNDMLEVAQFMVHVGGFGWEPQRVLRMVGEVPAQVLGLPSYGLKVGLAANLVVLDAADWHEALQFQALKTLVVLKGQVVAESKLEQTLRL